MSIELNRMLLLLLLLLLLVLIDEGRSISPNPNSCLNISMSNMSFGRIHSFNFYAGQSQPPNVSCSWMISNDENSPFANYIVSLRVLEVENDPTHWSNELSFWTGNRQISLDQLSNRTYFLSTSSSPLQIFFRTRVPLLQTYNPFIRTSLRIRRFLLEYFHLPNDFLSMNEEKNTFRCSSTGILIPEQWRCNCIYECPYGDRSDEENCPLCSMYDSSNSLICQSNEYWCLPRTPNFYAETLLIDDFNEDPWMQTHRINSRRIDPKGVCIPRTDQRSCLYSTNSTDCQKILALRQDHGQILLDQMALNNYQTLCLIIIAKEEYKIKFLRHQSPSSNEHSPVDWTIYDGSVDENRLLASTKDTILRDTIQTRESHIASLIIRRRTIEQASINSVLFNLTWMTSICPENQTLCGGHFEVKCYTAQQRCDGIWDCISGEDELGCVPEACPTTFACQDRLRLPTDQPRCYTWSERCNGNAFCANRTDEKFCSHWWCNSNNGTFLCQNLNCIYETWVCDGTDDCGDHSDEINCPSRLPRRIVTAAVIGATVCSTLFIIALGCTCKLFHLRTAERRAAARLLNPQRYIEQRRQQMAREQQQRQINGITPDPPSVLSEDARRIAPPSYNQTMGLMDENEERQAALAEHLRLAGLANYISLPIVHPTSRSSRSTSRHRHRRHRRHRHHHHRRTHSEGSRVALLEPTVVVSNSAFRTPSNPTALNRFHRLRSQLLAFFNSNPPTTTPSAHRERHHHHHHRSRSSSIQQFLINSRSDFLQTRELPPPYTEEQFVLAQTTGTTLSLPSQSTRHVTGDLTDLEGTNSNGATSNAPTTSNTSTSSPHRLRKRHMPVNTLRDRMRQFISGSTGRTSLDELCHPMEPTSTTTTGSASLDIHVEPVPSLETMEDEEPASSDDDKLLTP